jgi:two-component system, NarL family, response regulator NreC
MWPSERRPRVVLADDHPTVLVGFGRMLQPYCDVVASVSNGSEAVDAVSRLRPDVLVVDLVMPDLNGFEVCRRVKQAEPETDVVIVTAFDDTSLQAIAFQNGASAFLPKHLITQTLEPTIQRIFMERERTRQSIR